ncbi:MAG: hypothetical protein J5494_06850, partial [Candidatus Methanomethylophilaceae archaeon]|nr:hypothetical protein [Candidatus Methanomethylophilaceae archaeon]
MLKRFIRYYRPYRFLLVKDLAASFLISLIGMVYPVITNRMLNVFIPEKQYRTILISGITVLLLYILRMLLRYYVQYRGHMIGTHMQSDMRRELFDHLERLPYSFYDNHETGALMTRITSDLFDI